MKENLRKQIILYNNLYMTFKDVNDTGIGSRHFSNKPSLHIF